jgi:hypothetical protein
MNFVLLLTRAVVAACVLAGANVMLDRAIESVMSSSKN